MGMGMGMGMGGGGGGGGGMPPMMSHTEYPTFGDWISFKETGTSTGDVACFARPIFSDPIRRIPKKRQKKEDSSKGLGLLDFSPMKNF